MRVLEAPMRLTPLDEHGRALPTWPALTSGGPDVPIPHVQQWAGTGRLLLEYGPRIRPWQLGDDDEMTGTGPAAWRR